MYGDKLVTSIGFNNCSNYLNQFIDTLGDKRIIYTPINLGTNKTYYIDLSLTQPLLMLWKTNSYVYFSYNKLYGALSNSALDFSIFRYYVNSNQDITINKTISLSMNVYVN